MSSTQTTARSRRPGMRFVPAVVLAALLALAASTSALAVEIPHANGNDYLLPNGSIYQRSSDGCYRLIPNVSTANAMGIKWDKLQRVTSVSPVGAPVGAAIPTDSKANGRDYLLPDGNVYQLGAHCQFHLIPDTATANAMGVKWNELLHADTVGPIGSPIPSVVAKPKQVCSTKASIAANGHDYVLPKGNVYQRGADGEYHLIPDVKTANAMGVKWNQLLHAGSVSPIGSPIGSVCHTA